MTEHFAHALRERFDAAVPEVPLDPAPILRRARRRRRMVLGGAGLGAAALVATVAATAIALVNRPEPIPVAPPPPEEGVDISLWLSADEVPPGDVELAAVLVAQTGLDDTFGILAQVERWDGDSWEPHGQYAMCLVEYECTAELLGLEVAVDLPDVEMTPAPGVPGPVQRFSTAGLDEGWYRISEVGRRDVAARGVVQVVEGAETPAPLTPLGEPGISVQPALVTSSGGPVTLVPMIPGDGDQLDDAAVVEGLDQTAMTERWDGDGWTVVSNTWIYPGMGDYPANGTLLMPPLEPGAYRVVRSGPDGDHTGRFWVLPAAGQRDAVILEEYEGAPAGYPVSEGEGTVVDLDGDRVLVSTRGTDDCATRPVGTVMDGAAMTVVLRAPDGPCSAELPYTTYVLALPEDYVPSELGVSFDTRYEGSDAPLYTALRTWLADMITSAGYQPLDGGTGRLRASSSVMLDELVSIAVEPDVGAPYLAPGAVSRTATVGGIDVQHGADDRGVPAAQLVCGPYRIGFGGRNPTPEAVADTATVAEAIAAVAQPCPLTEAELLARYPVD